jgi:hypothetical protein
VGGAHRDVDELGHRLVPEHRLGRVLGGRAHGAGRRRAGELRVLAALPAARARGEARVAGLVGGVRALRRAGRDDRRRVAALGRDRAAPRPARRRRDDRLVLPPSRVPLPRLGADGIDVPLLLARGARRRASRSPLVRGRARRGGLRDARDRRAPGAAARARVPRVAAVGARPRARGRARDRLRCGGSPRLLVARARAHRRSARVRARPVRVAASRVDAAPRGRAGRSSSPSRSCSAGAASGGTSAGFPGRTCSSRSRRRSRARSA